MQMRFLYASPAYQRELGYDCAVLQEQGVDLVQLVHPEDAPRLLQGMQKALLHGGAPKVLVRMRHASGRLEAAEIALRAMPGRLLALVLRLMGPLNAMPWLKP